MKLLTRLALILALNGALPGCGLVISGRPPPDAELVADAELPDSSTDAPLDGGVLHDGGTALGCIDVEDIHRGYALDCELSCPWTDPSCSLALRNDCLSELQTAAGLHDCDRWERSLHSPLCTAACEGAPDGGHDAGVSISDGGPSDGGPALIGAGDACNLIIELWTVYELTSACLADGPGGASRPGRCPGWGTTYCDRDLVNACVTSLAIAASGPDCGEVFATWTRTDCATACRAELMP